MKLKRFSADSFLTVLFTAGTVFFLSSVGTPAWASSDLLNRGTEILKSLGGGTNPSDLSVGEIAGGLKDALRVGSERVVNQLGAADGFNADPAVHIPLPEKLSGVKSILDTIGMGGLLDDLELKLNRAAEAATPKAKKHFWEAIEGMTIEDAKSIYNGPDDAATRYFQEKMTTPLTEEIRPLVRDSLSEVGAINAYDTVMDKYKSVPLVPDAKANLTDYTIEKGLDGLFHYIAVEEAAIRKDPAKRTTELLKKVFGDN